MLASGEFREDLYYRLKVIEVTVPPLRERRSELNHLVELFINRYARRYNRPAPQLSAQLIQLFHSYDWPGNIRELENIIKRIVILQEEQLAIREMSRAPRHQPSYAVAGVGAAVAPPPHAIEDNFAPVEPVDQGEPDTSADESVPELPTTGSRLADVARAASMKAERALIEETLQQVHWNRRRAAEQLGVSYKTLLNKIKDCGITRA
jgi:two-component system response regulator AtoC